MLREMPIRIRSEEGEVSFTIMKKTHTDIYKLLLEKPTYEPTEEDNE